MANKIAKDRNESWMETQERKAAEKTANFSEKQEKELQGMKAALVLLAIVLVVELIMKAFGTLDGEEFAIAMISDICAMLLVGVRYWRGYVRKK